MKRARRRIAKDTVPKDVAAALSRLVLFRKSLRFGVLGLELGGLDGGRIERPLPTAAVRLLCVCVFVGV